MSAPVWTLSVDLQTKTATFQSGMSDAARAARGSFDEIKAGAATMGRETSGSMLETRESVVLLGEQFGIHMPRALSQFVARLGPVAAAMETAFPFIAIIAGATLLIEHLKKVHEASDRASEAGAKFGKDAADAMGHWDEKILQTDERVADLSGNYLRALQDRLQQIDHTTLHELSGQFDKLAGAALADFKNMETGWMSFLFLGKQDWGAKEAEQRIHALSAAMDSAKDVDAQKQVAVTALAGAQTRLNDLDKSYHTSMVSGTAEAISAYQKLIPQLQNILDLTNRAKESQDGEKNLQTRVSEDQHPEAFHPELFVDAENKKRVSLAETIELIKKQQKVTDEAAKLELDGMEGLSKGLKELAEERAKLAQEAGKEDAGHGSKMAELQAAPDREAAQMKMAAGRMSAQEYLDMELGFAAQEYNAKKQALQNELATLDQHAADYLNKKQALNNRLLELDRQFQNQDQQLEDQAQKKELASIQASESRMESAYAHGFSQVMMEKQSFGKMMQQLDSQMAEAAIQNTLMALAHQEAADEESRFSKARTAAAKAFAWPDNPIIGAVLAAGAFAAVMAFEGGGIVPGVERGDVVPARLEPGEAVLPKRMTERLNSASDSGDSRPHVHIHINHAPQIHALDSAGMERALKKNADVLNRHLYRELRKLNK